MPNHSKSHENNRLLSTLLKNLPGMAYRCLNDKDWTMEFVSEGCFDLTGYQPSHLIQNRKISYGQLIYSKDKKRVWNEVQSAVQVKKTFHTTYRITTSAGKEKWVREQGAGIFSPEGKLLALEGVITDITEDRIANEKIKHLNLVLRCIRQVHQILVREKDIDSLIKSLCKTLTKNRNYYNAWIAVLDKNQRLVTTAQANLDSKFLPILEGLKSNNLTACVKKALKQSGIIRTQDPLSTCKDCPLSKNYAGQGAMTVRLQYNKKIYGVLSVSISKNLIVEQDEVDLLSGVAKDIALGIHNLEIEREHNKINEIFKKSEKRFRTLIENSLSGLSIIQDNKIVYQNPEQERLLGSLPRSPNFTDIENIYFDDVGKVKRYYQEASLGNFPVQDIDFRFYPKDKMKHYQNLLWVHCRSTPIEYQGKEAILVNMTDITPIKRMEHLLRIQDKMESLGRIASGVAHEIRNPLSGINVFLDGIRENFEDPENIEDMKALIDQAKAASNKIESIVKRVLDFSKPSLPKLVLRDINMPIKEAVELSQVSLRKTAIKIECNLSDELPQLYIDSQLIEQVLLNMITNAAVVLKDIRGPKKIRITSKRAKDSILIRIGDSGPGVEPDIQEKIFEPFYTTKTDGSGIGLSICQRIISDHGGVIEISRSELGGAEFTISIPLNSA